MDPNFIDQLGKAIRYSADTVENLLSQLAADPHTRQGGPNADHTFRGVLADALQESDRPHAQTEADLLRNPDQHVVVDKGNDGVGTRVRAGQYTTDHIQDTLHLIRHHLIHEYSGDGLFDNVGFSMPTVRYLEKDGTATLARNGHLFSTTHINNAGPLLADTLQTLLDKIDGGRHNRKDEHLQGLLTRLRNVPPDRADYNHPSNEPV